MSEANSIHGGWFAMVQGNSSRKRYATSEVVCSRYRNWLTDAERTATDNKDPPGCLDPSLTGAKPRRTFLLHARVSVGVICALRTPFYF